MRYQFEVDEIKGCKDCPCCNSDCDYGASCNLGSEFNEFCRVGVAPESYIPLDCPLKIKDMPLDKLKELIAYAEIQWDGQPFTKGMLEGLKEALKIMEGK